MQPSTPESLASFYNEITDRQDTWEQLQYEKNNNPVFEGLNEKQIGKVINEAIGAPAGSRFDRFDSKTRWIDASGYHLNQLFAGAPTSIQGYKDQMAGKSTRNWSDVGADVGTATGRMFGVEGKGLDFWTEAGRGMPAGLGTLALAAVPVVGMPATLATTYGQGVDQAKAGGATAGEAMAVGAIDTAVNLLFLKAGGAISDRAAGSMLGATLGKAAAKEAGTPFTAAAGKAAAQALAESSGLVNKAGKQIAGRALVDFAKASGKITKTQAFSNRIAAEGISEAVAGAAGVAGQIAKEGILDYEGLKQNMMDPNYWATTIASEGVFAVLGTVVGNVRTPNRLADYTRPNETTEPDGTGSVFANTDNDAALVAKAKADQQQAAADALKQSIITKTGEEAAKPTVEDPASVMTDVAAALIADGTLGVNDNAAQAAAHLLNNKGKDGGEAAIMSALNQHSYDPPVLPTGVNNFRAEFNKLTMDVNTADGLANLVLDHETLLAPKEVGLAKLKTAEERAAFEHFHNEVSARLNLNDADFTPNFDADFTPEKIVSYNSFLEQTGIGEAAKVAKVKIHFVDSKKSKDWFLQFTSGIGASASRWRYQGSDVTHEFINAPDNSRASDLHEMGHVVDRILDDGGFGEQAKADWAKLKATYAPSQKESKVVSGANKLGAAFTIEAIKQTSKEGSSDRVSAEKSDALNRFSNYLSTQKEWSAQAFQGYFLNKPSKFKDFMQTNFPALHSVLDKVAQAFRKTITKKSVANKQEIMSAYQPGQVQANIFFESLFKAAGKESTETEARAMIRKYGLSAKAAESFFEAITAGNTLAGKAAAFEAVTKWGSSKDRNEQDLLDAFSFVNVVNKSAMSLQDLMTPSVASLPNARRLMSLNLDDVEADFRLRLKDANDQAAVDAALGHLSNIKHFAKRGDRALEAIGVVLSHKIAMAEKELSAQSIYDRGIQLLQVDSVLGKWFRGELPGQEGRFMWESRVKEDFTESARLAREGERGAITRREANEIVLQREFPILSKAIKAIKTSAKEEGYVAEAGAKKYGEKNKWFNTKAEADEYVQVMNSSGQNFGYSYSVVPFSKALRDDKGKLVKGPDGKSQKVNGFQIYYKKDDRKAVVAEYRDDLVQVKDALQALEDEPDTRAYVKQQSLDNAKMLYEHDLKAHIIRVTKRMFTDYRAGNINALPEQMRKALATFARWSGKEGWKTFEALRKQVGSETDKIDDIMLHMSNMSKQDRKDLLVFAGKEFETVFANYANYMKVWLRNDMNYNMELVLNNKLPLLSNSMTPWQDFVDGVMPQEDANFHEQLTAMQFAMPGGVIRKAASGVEYSGWSPRSTVAKAIQGIEMLHLGTFGGAQNIAETYPVFKPLGDYMDKEEPMTMAIGNRLTANLRGEMQEVTTPNGEKRLVAVSGSEKDDSEVYMKINNPAGRLKRIVDQMQLLQNKAGGIKFEQVQKNDLTVGFGSEPSAKAEVIAERAKLAKEANDLLTKNFDTNNPKHLKDLADIQNYLERTYAFQREMSQIRFERELHLHELTTANAFYQSLDFAGSVEHAKDLAKKLNEIAKVSPDIRNDKAFFDVLNQPVNLGGLGWDAHQAISFQDKWAKTWDAIQTLKDVGEATPGYVSEMRMKRFHVKYAARRNGKDVGSGLRDFDTAEEAWKFINDNKNNPDIAITSKRPDDQYGKNVQYRTGSDVLEKVVSDVINTRVEMLDMVLTPAVSAGKLSQGELDLAKKVFSGVTEDVSADATTGRIQSLIRGQRMFKAGREDLDMAYQQEESGWRMAIQYARRTTDAGFELHTADEALAKHPYLLSRFRTAKDALRTPDGKGQRMASKVAFSYFILANVSSAMVEAAQWPLSLSHILVDSGGGLMDSFRIPAAMMAKAGRASAARLLSGSDAGIWEPKHASLIKYAELGGRLGQRPLQDISTEATEAKLARAAANANPGTTSAGKKAAIFARVAYDSLNKFYAFFSRFNAEISLVSAYEVTKKAQYGNRKPTAAQEEALYEDAIRIANKANGTWGRGNRPWWFDTKSSSGRTVAQLAWSLQGFASNHVANHLRLLKKSIGAEESGWSKDEVKQARKALAVLTTMQVAGLGVMGHTMAGGISKLLVSTFGYDPESELKEWLEDEMPFEPEENQALADMVLYGLLQSSDLVPMDVAARMSVTGLGPINSFEGWNATNLGGPVLSTVGSLVDGWNTISKGDGSVESYMRWGVNMLPTGIQRAIRMELFDDGKVFNKSGTMIMEPTTGEKIAAYLGFASNRYTDYMKHKTKAIEAEQADGRERNAAASRVLRSKNESDRFSTLKLLETEAQRLRMDPKDLAARVADMEASKTHGPSAPTGKGPNAERAARLYKSPLPEAPELEVKKTKFQSLAYLNQLPQDWMRSLQNAQMVDNASSMFNISKQQAKQAIRDPRIRTTLLSGLANQTGPQTSLGLSGFSSLPY